MAINVKIAAAIKRLDLSHHTTFILAVSGGPDSQCLLKSFPHVALGFGHSCIAVGIDHGLRPEAGKELELAQSLAYSIGIGFHREQVHIMGKSNLQAKAREERYRALFDYANRFSADYVVTAHHFDDRAETVLIRLIRGDGIGSLAVLPEVTERVCGHALFRPMLQVTRSEILRHLKRWGVLYASDPSNENTHYLRVKIRKEILPALEELNPRIRERLNAIADELLRR